MSECMSLGKLEFGGYVYIGRGDLRKSPFAIADQGYGPWYAGYVTEFEALIEAGGYRFVDEQCAPCNFPHEHLNKSRLCTGTLAKLGRSMPLERAHFALQTQGLHGATLAELLFWGADNKRSGNIAVCALGSPLSDEHGIALPFICEKKDGERWLLLCDVTRGVPAVSLLAFPTTPLG